MDLEKLAQFGWYKTEPTSPREIGDLFSIVDRSVADLKVVGISDDLRFQAATTESSPWRTSPCGQVDFAFRSDKVITSV
jgi:hypothetical protein